MRKNLFRMDVVVALLVLLCGQGCQANRWFGQFVGAQETWSACGPVQAQTLAEHEAQRESARVILDREGPRIAFLEFGDCRVRLDIRNPGAAEVSSDQLCKIPIDGIPQRLLITGNVRFTSDLLTIELTGRSAAESGACEFKFTFRNGHRDGGR